jgi:hypothetical protein
MQIAELLNNKGLKAKAKVETLSGWLLNKNISTDQIIEHAASAKGPAKS